ncbi:MAG: HEPN domain-containing protein [Candidatus Woesearchaeota archaeon]
MDQIKWCLHQKKGIELVEPSENLRNAYLAKAEEALETLRTTKNRSWQLTTAYYTIYHGIYSLLMRIGVKCEIHSCTIEFAKRFLKNHFSKDDFELIDKAFSARIDSQYYINRQVTDKDHEFIIKNTPSFMVKCKNIIIEQKEIMSIREQISSIK